MHKSYYVWGSKANATLYPHHHRNSQPFFWIEPEDSRNNTATAMASSISTAVIFPLGFRNSPQNHAVSRTVRLSPVAMIVSHNLSFSRSVSGFAPTVVRRVPIVASPSRYNPKPLTIVSAKGYKMKTHKVKFFFVRILSFFLSFLLIWGFYADFRLRQSDFEWLEVER